MAPVHQLWVSTLRRADAPLDTPLARSLVAAAAQADDPATAVAVLLRW
jgi:hypothetical protein